MSLIKLCRHDNIAFSVLCYIIALRFQVFTQFYYFLPLGSTFINTLQHISSTPLCSTYNRTLFLEKCYKIPHLHLSISLPATQVIQLQLNCSQSQSDCSCGA